MTKANKECWKQDRDEATSRFIAASKQKAAEAAAKSASTAERIRDKLLRRLEAEIDKLPETIGTEMEKNVSNYTYEDGKKSGGRVKSRTDGGMRYKLRDLTAAYRDLIETMPKEIGSADDPLAEVLKRWNDAAGIE